MFHKKMNIERRRNRVFILFLSLYCTHDKSVQDKIKSVTELFAADLLIKMTSSDQEILDTIQTVLAPNDFAMKKNGKDIVLIFHISSSAISSLINIIDAEKTSLEIFKYTDSIEIEKYWDKPESFVDFYFFISDNDGPFLIFDKNKYAYRDIMKQLKIIL